PSWIRLRCCIGSLPQGPTYGRYTRPFRLTPPDKLRNSGKPPVTRDWRDRALWGGGGQAAGKGGKAATVRTQPHASTTALPVTLTRRRKKSGKSSWISVSTTLSHKSKS